MAFVTAPAGRSSRAASTGGELLATGGGLAAGGEQGRGFFRIETSEVVRREPAHGWGGFEQPRNPSADVFEVRGDRFVQGSGVFFALKTQTGQSRKDMDFFLREVEQLQKLRGNERFVQIRDHAVSYEHNSCVILMELAAGDLRCLLEKTCSSGSCPTEGGAGAPGLNIFGVHRIWDALVRAVEAAHKESIIHRDLKPENFLLVPVMAKCPFADRILATTPTPPDQFRFRLLNQEGDDNREGDVEVTCVDAFSGKEAVLLLSIKLSDFGLARPLEIDTSHLSVDGFAGTLQYSAPETLRINEDDKQKVSKSVDIWSLGVMLFEMLHNGRTPFERYKKRGRMHLGMAIITKSVHPKVMQFEQDEFWDKQQQALERRHLEDFSHLQRQLEDVVNAWIQTNTLFRICKRCLIFDASERVEQAADLRRLMGSVDVDRGAARWVHIEEGRPGDAGRRTLVFCTRAGQSRETICTIDVDNAGMKALSSSSDKAELLKRVGNKVGEALFPELWKDDLVVSGHDPSSAEAEDEDSLGCKLLTLKSPSTEGEEQRPLLCGRYDTGDRFAKPSSSVGGSVAVQEKESCKRPTRVVIICIVLALLGGVVGFVFSRVSSHDHAAPSTESPPPSAPTEISPFLSPQPQENVTSPAEHDHPTPEHPATSPIVPAPGASPVAPTPAPSVAPRPATSSSFHRPAHLPPPASSALQTQTQPQPAGPVSSPPAVKFLPPLSLSKWGLPNNKNVVLGIVGRNGLALQYAAPFQADPEVVLAAVTSDAGALKYAASELRHDENIVLQALKTWNEQCIRNDNCFSEPVSAISILEGDYKNDKVWVTVTVEDQPEKWEYGFGGEELGPGFQIPYSAVKEWTSASAVEEWTSVLCATLGFHKVVLQLGEKHLEDVFASI